VNTTVVRDEAGQPLRPLAVNQDITGNVHAEEGLRESHTLLRSVVEGANEAILLKDVRGRYVMVNSTCASIMGKPKEEILDKVDSEILLPEVASRLVKVE
jgi:PAS domain-containing protein